VTELQQGEYLEPNIEFAHKIGLSLNQLIDAGVLSAKDVSVAPPEAFFEFAQRYQKKSKDGFLSEEDNEKVRTLFSSEYLSEETGPNREQIISLTREFLKHEQQTGLKIAGIVLFGSRMDPNKKPRPDSDIDMLLVLDMSQNQLFYELRLLNQPPDLDDETPRHMQFTREDSYYADLSTSWRNFCLHSNQAEATELTPRTGGLTNVELFTEELKLQDHLPFWGYFPQAVYFVGNVDNVSETEVNDRIQNILNSQEASRFKQELLDRIKSELIK